MVAPEVLKTRISRVIAATRFPFVGQDDWDESRTTIANDPRDPEWCFDTPDGSLAPSVVVLNADGSVRECGEVEMSQVFSGADVEKWRIMSLLTGLDEKYKKFFLYVPEGSEDEALRLLEENDIEYAGLRTWELVNWNLVLRPIKTPDMAKDHR
ncbi:hypothetical protein MUP51_02720 [Candidatus Bathyarchaeota archaeon]|nr:hypothetical protein [Candidatus Bathyarchaeota archaeon]